MKTVKEISKLTGISVRTLHYYDEIGLLTPTEKTEAGYRLYDEQALEALQQILFFREFDIPLKDIKTMMENPALEKNQILLMQRKMLLTKKERLERLIVSIDNILKGDNQMDFEVFSKTELEDLYDTMEKNLSESQKAIFIEQYGSIDAWKRQFLENASKETVQKNFQKVIEWYGSKESMLEAVQHPSGSDLFLSYQKRMGDIMKRLSLKKGQDVHSFEVKQLIGEYDFVAKQLYQMKDVTGFMLDLAAQYQNSRQLQEAQDKVYGEGATAFMGKALEAFYKK